MRRFFRIFCENKLHFYQKLNAQSASLKTDDEFQVDSIAIVWASDFDITNERNALKLLWPRCFIDILAAIQLRTGTHCDIRQSGRVGI